MCDKVKGYLSVLREYKSEFIMVLGFAVAFGVYWDLRGFVAEQAKWIAETAKALQEMNVRIQNLEHNNKK